MASLQDEPPPSTEAISQLRRDYRDWHTRARRLLAGDQATQFDEQRDGGIFSAGVGKYVDDPRQESVLKAEDGTFPLGRWQYPFATIRGRLEKQRSLLLESAPEESPAEAVASDLAMSFANYLSSCGL